MVLFIIFYQTASHYNIQYKYYTVLDICVIEYRQTHIYNPQPMLYSPTVPAHYLQDDGPLVTEERHILNHEC